MSNPSRPLAVAIVNDYEIVVRGLAAMLEPYADRVRVVELEVGGEPSRQADVTLFDTFAGRRHCIERAEKMVIDRTVEQQRSHSELSMREREVLALVALGMTNREVADELYLSVDTVKTYVKRLYSKMGVSNRTQAALKAAGYDVQPPPSRLS